jgi:hypothetical protein
LGREQARPEYTTRRFYERTLLYRAGNSQEDDCLLCQNLNPQPKGYKVLFKGGRMNKNKLNREDQELLETFEAGE